MTANNTQFVLDGAQYTITLKAGSLTGRLSPGSSTSIRAMSSRLRTISTCLIERTPDHRNGTTYPLTTSGYSYTITTANTALLSPPSPMPIP